MIAEFSSSLDALIPSLPTQIAVAVSGGADSFALLHLTHQWAKEKNISIIALTIDHQLRPESAEEAHIVAQWCQLHGISHHTLHWHGEKPTTAIQAKARNARRHLLCQACQQRDIKILVLGHQADDQAETMMMRLQRGTGLKGLKAMQPMTRDPATHVAILRPLLSVRRAALRAYCVENDLPFIDDPSNDKTEFERVRVRQALQALPELATGITKTAVRLKRADDTLNQLAQSWFNAHAQTPQPQKIWLPLSALTDTLPEIQLRILNLACTTLDNETIGLPQLESLHGALNADDFTGITVGNYWIKPKALDKTPGFLFQIAPPRTFKETA
jgi:tRNA(Ile)-lysidine synthase